MPKNAVILLIRHAEKPDFGPDLTEEGERHAQAYVHFFNNFHLGPRLLKIDALFAAADSKGSFRPRLTLIPLAAALKLPIQMPYEDKQIGKMADHLLSKKFDGKTVLVCWKHSELLPLADALGATAHLLRPKTQWPLEWPDNQYNWILQIAYDGSNQIDRANTYCIRQPAIEY